MMLDTNTNFALTPEILLEEIENIVKRRRLNYFDALVYYCEKNNIDQENISNIIPESLKFKIAIVASELRMLKKKYRTKYLFA